jgi:hypothetical protein
MIDPDTPVLLQPPECSPPSVSVQHRSNFSKRWPVSSLSCQESSPSFWAVPTREEPQGRIPTWILASTTQSSRDQASKPFALTRGDIFNTVGCLARIAFMLAQCLFALNAEYYFGDKGALETIDHFEDADTPIRRHVSLE